MHTLYISRYIYANHIYIKTHAHALRVYGRRRCLYYLCPSRGLLVENIFLRPWPSKAVFTSRCGRQDDRGPVIRSVWCQATRWCDCHVYWIQDGLQRPSEMIFSNLHHHLIQCYPNSKVHGASMGPIWGRQDPGGPHVGPMNFAIWVVTEKHTYSTRNLHTNGDMYYKWPFMPVTA